MVPNYLQFLPFLLIDTRSSLDGLREIIVSFFKLICRVIQLPGKAIIAVITAFCRHVAKKATWNWSETNETFAATCLVQTFCNDGPTSSTGSATAAMAVPHYAGVQRALVLRTHNLCPSCELYLCFYVVIWFATFRRDYIAAGNINYYSLLVLTFSFCILLERQI